MPKFYHGEQLGFAYKARAVGWRRIFPLSLLPYLTGDKIELHLSLKPLFEGLEWQQGTLQIEPPELERPPLLREWRPMSSKKPRYRAITSISSSFSSSIPSDYVFPFIEYKDWTNTGLPTPPKYEFPVNKWWSRTLPLKGGVSFGQPCNIECSLSFQNIDDDKIEETTPIRIADIEVVSRGPFLEALIRWGFTTAIAIVAIILLLVC